MKKLFLLPILFLFGCGLSEPSGSGIVDNNGEGFHKYDFKIKKVKVDGVWYYASETYYNNWVLGPRVPEEAIEKGQQ